MHFQTTVCVYYYRRSTKQPVNAENKEGITNCLVDIVALIDDDVPDASLLRRYVIAYVSGFVFTYSLATFCTYFL